jgi:long-chain acyl-CoA synthetase
MNLTELLDRTASRWPQKPAFIEGTVGVSYAELVERVAALATHLKALEVTPGLRVGLCFPNSISYVALTFALWRLDAVVVPVPTECTEEEVSEIARTLELGAILSQKSLGKSLTLDGDSFFTRLPLARVADNHGLNIAFIRFTSGTTNSRKGVVLSHESVSDRVLAANKALRIVPEDRVVWCLPMSHHFLITIVLYISEGATIVLARHVLARPFLEEVNRSKGTVLYAAPFHYALLARDDSGLGLPSVRLAVSTTCALPQDVGEDFYKRFGLPLVQALGVIELGLACLNIDDPRGRPNSVGRPPDGYQVRIVAPDDEGCGEVAIAGPGFFDAYAAPWQPRNRVLQDGWFFTGDLGWLDDDGFLFLAGRKNAVINLAGRKVFPEEIEAVLNRHPAVRESRVYGRLHPHLGEMVEAEVVLAQAEAQPEAIRDFCRVHLASYKIPSRLHFVSALPRTAVTGKIRRAVSLAGHD